MKNDPRFEYVKEMHELEIDQVRESPLGTRYTILVIEKSGYCICRRYKETVRLWCDTLYGWRVIG